MDLLFFIGSLGGGGAERVLVKLASHFADRGHCVTVATLTSSDTDRYTLPVSVQRVQIDAPNTSNAPLDTLLRNLRRTRTLRQVVQRLRPAYLISFMPAANAPSILAVMGTNTRAIISERSHPPNFPLGGGRKAVQQLLYRRAHRLVVLTQQTAEWARENWRCENLEVIPNGVSLPLPEDTPRICPADIVDAQKRTMLCVGRLEESKQFSHAIRAFAEVDHTNWELVIIGAGSLEQSLKALAEQCRLGSQVKFLDRVGNMQTWYEHADLFVLTSRCEGFPNVLLEAMACGCAVIAYDCPTGPAEIIEDGKNGVLVPANDLDKLRTCLGEMMDHPETRSVLGQAARGVRTTHQDESFFRDWEKVIDSESSVA